MSDDWEEFDVPGRGVLTDSQRNFLRHELIGDLSGYKPHQRRQYRSRIRDNFQGALIDIQFLENTREMDQLQVIKPLMELYELNGIADWRSEQENVEELENALENYGSTDKRLGAEMERGIVSLLATYVKWFGPQYYQVIVQQALDEATAFHALQANRRDLEAYTVNLELAGPALDVLADRWDLEEFVSSSGEMKDDSQ